MSEITFNANGDWTWGHLSAFIQYIDERIYPIECLQVTLTYNAMLQGNAIYSCNEQIVNSFETQQVLTLHKVRMRSGDGEDFDDEYGTADVMRDFVDAENREIARRHADLQRKNQVDQQHRKPMPCFLPGVLHLSAHQLQLQSIMCGLLTAQRRPLGSCQRRPSGHNKTASCLRGWP